MIILMHSEPASIIKTVGLDTYGSIFITMITVFLFRKGVRSLLKRRLFR
jgi:hypothetical protein